MKSFGFTLLVLIIIVGLCVGGYFAYKSMTSPASYLPTKTQTVGDLHMITSDPDTGTTSAAGATAAATSTTNSAAPAATAAAPTTTTSDNSALIANINTLIKNKTVLRLGSKGVSVGYIEQFTNLYFKKSSTIDNDFGKTLQANITTFQKQNKISATGTVATATLQMMVTWLQNN
jgi:peptidoglycan hydrolase-like protein with peptidoglycan-binding domain